MDEVAEATLQDPRIQQLCDRIGYTIDERSAYPVHYSGTLVIRLRDGRTLTHVEAINRGSHAKPLSADEVVEKLPPDRVARAAAASVHHLAARGWVCVSADYRLSPHATFPDFLVDLKRAIQWIREHGREYGANPDFLAVTGGSAGGHLAALVGLTANDPAYQPGFEQVDTSVQACVPFYGVYDFTDRHGFWPHQGLTELLEQKVMKGSIAEIPDRYEEASPLGRIRPDAPPFFIIHGAMDTLVPVGEARKFAETLRRTSRNPVVYAEIPGAQHAFELFPSLRSIHVTHGVERFLASIYCRELAQRADAESAAADRAAS